jgi:hypothetical protein
MFSVVSHKLSVNFVSKYKGIKFCDGPFILGINLLTSEVKYFGIAVIVWLIMCVKYCNKLITEIFISGKM